MASRRDRRLRLTFVLGTRPEAIKLAPVIRAAELRGHETQVVISGQHEHMVGPLLDFFGVRRDIDLGVMTAGQALSGLSTRILAGLDARKSAISADFLIVQGDTTTAFCAAFWAFCQRIPIVHVEAGLRTNDLSAPFPEEGNRQLIGRIAQVHFAPTTEARDALLREGVVGSAVRVVGNTGVDALLLAMDRLKQSRAALDPNGCSSQNGPVLDFIGANKLVLVTAHRRESFGAPLEDICRGIRRAADLREDVRIVYPVHPNPQVAGTAHRLLSGHPRILLCDPLPYPGFVDLMARAAVLLTDSGGIQEEGPSLRIPILVMRDVTERPEGVAAGFSRLVGTNATRIEEAVLSALDEGCRGRGPNPYGDGATASRIIRDLEGRAAGAPALPTEEPAPAKRRASLRVPLAAGSLP